VVFSQVQSKGIFMKLSLIALSIAFFSATAKAKVITCQNAEALGIPVVQLSIEKNAVLEAREIFQSSLTGLLESGQKLKIISSKDKNLFSFHLGTKYTEDYTLVVNLGANPLTVTLNSIDRDDWTGTSKQLVNCQ
jgi:hypothetical protein